MIWDVVCNVLKVIICSKRVRVSQAHVVILHVWWKYSATILIQFY